MGISYIQYKTSSWPIFPFPLMFMKPNGRRALDKGRFLHSLKFLFGFLTLWCGYGRTGWFLYTPKTCLWGYNKRYCGEKSCICLLIWPSVMHNIKSCVWHNRRGKPVDKYNIYFSKKNFPSYKKSAADDFGNMWTQI